MGLRDFLFGSDQPDDLEQAFATGEIDAETYQEGLKAKAKAEAQATAEKQKALEEAQQSRSLQAGAKPSTHAESNGYQEDDHFSKQDLGSSELQEIKEMRESGGIISQWVHARALLEFGTGAEFESEEDRLAEYLNDELENLDNLLISLGEDAIWYPRSYAETVETRGGDFSHVECIEPWTMDPTTDQHGEITRFTQEIQNKEVGTFSPDEIGYFILNKSSGRDKLGISQVWRAKDEIQTYLDNKNSVANAIELAGFPHVHWKVGAEDSMIINDNELRRVRNIVGNMDSDSQIVTGTDVDHEVMEPTTFDFTEILTHDARQVATALGVPIEVATVISEGLGSGEQSNFRRRWFESQAKADRRMLSGQFIEQVAKPILIEYGGFAEDLVRESNIHIEFGPLFEDDNTSDMLNQIGEDLTVNERRAAYDKEPLDDEEVGESYDTARGETTEEAEGEGGGIFGSEPGDTDFRNLAVPDNAVSIDDRSEAPDDAQIVTGDQGGLYYIPAGEGADSQDEVEQQIDEVLESDQADWKKRDELQELTEEATGINSVRYDDFSPEQAADATRAFSALSDAGETDGLNGITSSLSAETQSDSPNAALSYKPQRQTIEISPEFFNQEQVQEWNDENHMAGDSTNHLISHEVGHHQHFEAHRDGDIDIGDAQDYEFTPQERNMIETELSTYATASPLEFVAESYGVKATGGDLSPPLQDLYEELGGTEPV